MEYIIRKCEERDLSELIALCGKHSEFEQVYYNPTGKRDLLKNEIFSPQPRLFCFVIESNNKLQGYFSYTFDFSTWDAQTFLYLDCLYIEPDFRGFKVGEIVFEMIKEFAKQNDCVNIQWQTPAVNERAIKFYNRMGGTSKDKVRFFFDIR